MIKEPIETFTNPTADFDDATLKWEIMKLRIMFNIRARFDNVNLSAVPEFKSDSWLHMGTGCDHEGY